jgi:hypothetical protein
MATIEKSAQDRVKLMAEMRAEGLRKFHAERAEAKRQSQDSLPSSQKTFWRVLATVAKVILFLDGRSAMQKRRAKRKGGKVKNKKGLDFSIAAAFRTFAPALHYIGVRTIAQGILRLRGERRARYVNHKMNAAAFMSSKPFTIPGLTEPVLWNAQTKIVPFKNKNQNEQHDHARIEVTSIPEFDLSESVPIFVRDDVAEWTRKDRAIRVKTRIHAEAHVRLRRKGDVGRAWAITFRAESEDVDNLRLTCVAPSHLSRLYLQKTVEFFEECLNTKDWPGKEDGETIRLEDLVFWIDDSVPLDTMRVTVQFHGKDFVIGTRTSQNIPIQYAKLDFTVDALSDVDRVED